MREQRGAVGPLLEENQLERIIAVDMHRMRDAAGLGARAVHMLETEPAHLVERVRFGGNAAGDGGPASPSGLFRRFG